MGVSVRPSLQLSENKGPTFLAVALVFTIIALIFVLLRACIRWVRHAFGWDDGMVVLSMILAIISTAFNVPEVRAGYGRHQLTLSEVAIMESLKWNYLATPLLVLSLAASKISICLLLLRVLDKTRARFKRSFPFGMILLLTLNAIPSAVYALVQCQPVRKLWDHSVPGHCQDPNIFVRFGYANGTINAFADFALAVFPFSFIKDLRLQLHRKVTLGLLMCCGIVCGVLAITRTILTGDLTAQSDITYDSVDSSLFALVEENVSIIVSCVPTLGLIYQTCYQRTKSLGSRYGRHEGGQISQGASRKDIPVPLQKMAKPPSTVVQYSASANAADSAHVGEQTNYGSQTSLVGGILKTSKIEVRRSEV